MITAENPLQNRIAVVTGGGRGIGAAISARLAQLGATVVICGRSEDTLHATAGRLRAAGAQCEQCVAI